MKPTSKELLQKITELKKEIHNILSNKLTYPKSVVGVAKDRMLNEQEIEKIKDCIDESIQVTDAKFIELIDSLEI